MIDKAKLLKLGLFILALISMGAFLSWYLTSNSYEAKLATQKSSYDTQLKAISDKAALDLADAVTRNNKLQSQLNGIDTKHYQELQNAKANNNQLKLDVANGTKRVQFAEAKLAACKFTRTPDSSSSSMGDGATIEFSGTAGQNILDIRGGIISDRAKLIYLQDYLRKIEESKNGKVNNQSQK
jgi:prophage endopeptidase